MVDAFGAREMPRDPAPGQRLGRYTVLERLGAGGMGAVFLAHDPELDRNVALKLLRPDGVSEGSKVGEHTERLDAAGNTRDLVRERILAEGRALARLRHPNLVTVFEVGAAGDRLFLAMEHVAGPSLTGWLAARARSWREVLAVFVQAGRGLAAAHEARLVHGDFKPDNVVIEEPTGRAYVVDFGLARAAGAGIPLAGTPRYMAPEQWSGRPIDQRADQFAFAVALFEALYGEQPLPADGDGQMSAGFARPSVRRGPARVERAVLRALSIDPDGRFPSMAAFLAAIERRPVALRRALAAAAVLGLAGGLAVALPRGASEPDRCTGGPARLAGVWDAARRARLDSAFAASGRAHAATSAARVATRLDDYAAGWQAMYRSACQAAARGEQSAALLDRRMACLDRRLEQVRARAAMLSENPGGELVDRALTLLEDIEPLEPCADTGALLAATAPPADTARRAAAAALDTAVDHSSMDRQAGRLDAALRGAREAVDGARALDHPPLLARAAHAYGLALSSAGRPAEAEEALHEAHRAAERAGDDALAAQVLIRLVLVVGRNRSRFTEGRTLARLAEAALGRAGERADRDLGAELLGVLGQVAFAEGKPIEAEKQFRESLTMRRELLGPDDARLATSENRLGTALTRLGRYEDGRRHFGAALAIRRRVLGVDHPQTAEVENNIAVSYEDEGRTDEARAHYERALAVLEPIPEYPKGSLYNNLGNLENAAGNFDKALRHHEAALADRRARLGPAHAEVAMSLGNIGSVHMSAGRLDRAVAILREVVLLRRRALGESHADYAAALLSLGEALRRSGRKREALPYHERAVAVLVEGERDDPRGTWARAFRAVARLDVGRTKEAVAELEETVPLLPEREQNHAVLRFALARGLVALRRDRARALELARSARATLSSVHRVREAEEIDAWLARQR
jgi:tetratricopeptide (TPR) repeat protein